MTKLAKVFPNGRSQAVRLPQEFRFSGTEVRVSRHGHGVLLEPVAPSVEEWFDALDRFKGEPFLSERCQPIAAKRKALA